MHAQTVHACALNKLQGDLWLQVFKDAKVGQWIDRQILCDHVTLLMLRTRTAWPEVVKCIWRALCIFVVAEGRLIFNLYQCIGGIFLFLYNFYVV